MKKPNILIGTALVFKEGGVRTHMLTLHNSFLEKGLDSSIYHLSAIKPQDIVLAGIKGRGNRDKAHVELVKNRVERSRRSINNLLKDKDISILHAHDVLLGSLAEDLDIPVVLTVHGPMSREARMLDIAGKHFFSYVVEQERKAYEMAKHIIAVDTGQKEIIIKDYNIDPHKISVILNSVEIKGNTSTRVTPEKSFILVPRRLVPKNGVSVAIEAFAKIKAPTYELWIAGDGPEGVFLKKMVNKIGISNNVKFLGAVDHERMLDLIRAASLILIPSVPVNGVVEASSISALEGMSMGKAVVASDIGGLQEMIKHEENGFLCPPGDSDRLAEIIEKLMQDKDLRDMVGQKSRVYVVERHSISAWREQILDVYKGCC